jgi:hypothetical protein
MVFGLGAMLKKRLWIISLTVNNLKFVGSTSFGTRDGIGRHQQVASPLSNILRVYNYPTSDKNTLLVLVSGGLIYHVVDSTTIFGPILSIAAMTDFGFASIFRSCIYYSIYY